MIKIYKNDKENSQQVVRRFSKIMKKSGILRKAKANRFFQRAQSEQLKKRSAIKKEELREKYKRLRKLGQLGKK